MNSDAKELIKQGDSLFSARGNLISLWQDTAENFYPERADFTTQRTMGDSWVENLTSSDPLVMRRELGNMMSAMLRPRGVEWFSVTSDERDDLDSESIGWLEERTKRMSRLMYDYKSGFVEATKQGDHDYVTFGQNVLKIERNYADYTLLVRNRHLRDVVWTDGYTGRTDTVHEKCKPSAWDLSRTFAKNKLHKNVLKALDKEPDRKFECRHVVVPSARFSDKGKTEFLSFYIDIENQHVIEQVGSKTLKYVIPRWQTVSGSQYSYSQAALAGLPAARLLQAVTLTLLEAGEKHVSPPMIAVENALRGDLNLFADGVTYVDAKYDERLGEVLRPITQSQGGYGHGVETLDRVRMQLRECFFLDKMSLPSLPSGATATQVMQIVQDHARSNLPLFEPVEHNYNAPLCEMLFEEMMGMGFMGRPEEIPQMLQGKDVRFKFTSPLQEQEDKLKAERLIQSIGLIAQVAPIDPTATSMIKTNKALREALRGLGDPEDWLTTEDEMAAIAEQKAALQQQQMMMAQLGQGAEIAQKAGDAGVALKEAVS